MDVDSRYIKIFPERLAAYCVVDAAREIALAEGEPLRWFFAISKLHRALSCALVAALRGSAGIGAYPAKGRRLWLTWFDESRTNDIPPPQWDRVDTVSNLMERARDPAELEMSGEPLRLSEDQIRDLDRLNQFRDDLEHIKPRYWLLEVGGLPRVAGAAVEALDQLFMRGSVRLHLGEEELRSALEAIAVIKACAERSPSIAPKCPFENSHGVRFESCRVHMRCMWTKEHRERQKAFERRRYPTDLTDEEWERIRPILPQPARRGRKPKVDLREILNALRYLARAGCGWRMLPHEFGPWQTVYWWFRRFVRRLLFQTLHDVALMLDREQAGRQPSPTASVIDSQTVKAPSAPGGGGYDAAKKVKGRKRHIAVDTDGRLLMINLTTADIQDAQGAEQIIKGVRQRWPWLKHLFADGAYDRGKLMSQAAYRDFVIEIVRKLSDQQGFQPLPRRWVVERTFGWMTRWRRLVRDYEERCDVSEAMIGVAMSGLMLRRIAHP